MKILYTLFIFFCWPAVFLAQSAIVSAGGSVTSSGGSISYSVGQIAYESYGNSSYNITEGVQQVFIINILGCMSTDACNYDAQANVDDGGCQFIGDACDDNNTGTVNDTISENCTCMGVISSVETSEGSAFQLYPNPTSQQLRIQSGANQMIEHLEILDMAGNRVLIENPMSSSVILNVTSLAAGQYFVDVKSHAGYKRAQIQIIR